jgi:hypothetical protein
MFIAIASVAPGHEAKRSQIAFPTFLEATNIARTSAGFDPS